MTVCFLPRGNLMAVALAALLSWAPGLAVAQASPATPGDFVRQFQAALDARDVDRVLQLYAEDGVVLTPQGGVLAGRTSIRDVLARNLAANQPALRLMNANFDGDAERGVLVWVWHADPASHETSARGRRLRSMLYLRNLGSGWRIVAESAQIFTAPAE